MFSGNKGSGKSTLINHFLFSIFDEDNYDKMKNFKKNSNLLIQFKKTSFLILYI